MDDDDDDDNSHVRLPSYHVLDISLENNSSPFRFYKICLLPTWKRVKRLFRFLIKFPPPFSSAYGFQLEKKKCSSQYPLIFLFLRDFSANVIL